MPVIKSKLQHHPPPSPFPNLSFPGSGEFDLYLGGVEKIEPEVSVTAINTCLDGLEKFKERDIAFVSDWLTKKVFKSCLQRNFCWVIRLYHSIE